ncbi:cytochrome P450 [Williamsia sterculiae]|uniref:Cytochrome P450 n=1 Tax=Williamsia sterculiae TaxID=1344003 RepID=A0A1N7HEU5_9NOCA|nr:cytochrome P450 [Williamsia sterculiae]SIS23406.1 Cytochrome P450 [Williamsia sterculiae]
MPEFAHASLIDGIRFTGQIGVPSVLQGLFVKRSLPTSIATLASLDRLGYGLVEGLIRSHGPGPFYVRVALDEALVVSAPEDIQYVLSRSPDPFASDPETKRKGMRAFQPDALTLSRGSVWADRRVFTEAVLGTGQPVHRLSDQFLQIANDETDTLERPLRWRPFHTMFRRLTRQVIFGRSARDDTDLSRCLESLMSEGNNTPDKPGDDYAKLLSRIHSYLDAPEEDSLAWEMLTAPRSDTTKPAGQVIHWMFAMGDTLATNTFRALAAIAAHPDERDTVRTELAHSDLSTPTGIASLPYLSGCLREAMRLWPTTPMFGRVTTRRVKFPNGATVDQGTQILIYNLFNHRNRHHITYADKFSPNEWVDGNAANEWSFNFFSHGPQGCPGTDLALLLGQAVLARLISSGAPELPKSPLKPSRPMPYTLSPEGLTIALNV